MVMSSTFRVSQIELKPLVPGVAQSGINVIV